MYVKTNDGVGVLLRTDSRHTAKYHVRMKEGVEQYVEAVTQITEQEYNEYKPATKQPAKRSKKS